MIRKSTVAVYAVSLAALTGLAACSSSAKPAPSSSPATKSASTLPTTTGVSTPADTTATHSTAVPASGTAATTSGGDASGSTQCAESQLRANVVAADIPGLNRHVVKLTFTNKSGATCTLTGFPGAAIVDDSGKQVQQAKRVVGGPVGGTIERSAGPIALRPGATAYAWLEGASTRERGAAQAGCDGPKYPRILVTPPNTETAVPFTIGWPQCYAFDVHPVRQD